MNQMQHQKAGHCRHSVRRGGGGQPVHFPRPGQQVRPHPAYGQRPVRCPAGPLVRSRRWLSCASLIRNLLGLGTIMAFPGSMCGALLCGLVFWKTRNLPATLVGEVFGTGIIGGLAAYPVAILFTGADAATVAFYAYIVPFLISTVGGSIIAGVVLIALEKNSTLKKMQASLAR